MINHVSIGVRSIATSKAFYDAAFVVDPDGYRIEAYCSAKE